MIVRSATAIGSVLDLTALFTRWKAAGTLASIAEAKTAVFVRAANIVRQSALTADLVVSIAGPRAALPERAAKVGARLATGYTAVRVALAQHSVPGVLCLKVLLSIGQNGQAQGTTGDKYATSHCLVYIY